MSNYKLFIVGLGPGSPEDMTAAAVDALHQADVVVGYKYYFRFVQPFIREDCQCVDTGMRRERERAEQAFDLASQGKTVAVISSGDAGIYGMAPLIYEMAHKVSPLEGAEVVQFDIEVIPGISAFQKAASLLGAPVSHDFCVISLSDLMTPWAVIEKRIRAAATADFVTAVYNPRSHERYWQLPRLREIFLAEGRSPETPVGIVRQAGRPEQQVSVTTLADLDPEAVDMFTVLIIGNSQSYIWNRPLSESPRGGERRGGEALFVTPRGYYPSLPPSSLPSSSHPNTGGAGEGLGEGLGAQIMNESFRTILSEMKHPDVPRWRLWPLLHAIHTTVDFNMERQLWMDERATEIIYGKITDGTLRHIVTDVTMAASGIRKGALNRLGIEVHCYINDPRSKQMAEDKGITRSQACMQLAAEEYPDALYVVGNAPTALFEICDLVRQGKMHPAGIIAAPVGFVHVCESKHAVKTLTHIPKFIIEGRKGGSNLAATLCNAILTYDDAEQLKPGRDL